jgi:hypothetical protein
MKSGISIIVLFLILLAEIAHADVWLLKIEEKHYPPTHGHDPNDDSVEKVTTTVLDFFSEASACGKKLQEWFATETASRRKFCEKNKSCRFIENYPKFSSLRSDDKANSWYGRLYCEKRGMNQGVWDK